jgi:hypothetical protein
MEMQLARSSPQKYSDDDSETPTRRGVRFAVPADPQEPSGHKHEPSSSLNDGDGNKDRVLKSGYMEAWLGNAWLKLYFVALRQLKEKMDWGDKKKDQDFIWSLHYYRNKRLDGSGNRLVGSFPLNGARCGEIIDEVQDSKSERTTITNPLSGMPTPWSPYKDESALFHIKLTAVDGQVLDLRRDSSVVLKAWKDKFDAVPSLLNRTRAHTANALKFHGNLQLKNKKGWDRYWFELDEWDQLNYYDKTDSGTQISKSQNEIVGQISLDPKTKIKLPQRSDGTATTLFQITTATGQFMLKAQSAGHCEQWLNQLRWRIQALREDAGFQREDAEKPKKGLGQLTRMVPRTWTGDDDEDPQENRTRATTAGSLRDKLVQQKLAAASKQVVVEKKGTLNGNEDEPDPKKKTKSKCARLCKVLLIATMIRHQDEDSKEELENPVFTTRLVLFLFMWVCSFTAAQLNVASSLKKGIVCIVFVSLSMAIGVGFGGYAACHHMDKDAKMPEQEAKLLEGRFADDEEEIQLWSRSCIRCRRAFVTFVTTANILAAYTILGSSLDLLGGHDTKGAIFCSIVVIDFVVITASICLQWLVVREKILKIKSQITGKDELTSVTEAISKQHRDNQKHITWSKLMQFPNAYHASRLLVFWMNISGLAFVSNMDWTSSGAFGWIWEYAGVATRATLLDFHATVTSKEVWLVEYFIVLVVSLVSEHHSHVLLAFLSRSSFTTGLGMFEVVFVLVPFEEGAVEVAIVFHVGHDLFHVAYGCGCSTCQRTGMQFSKGYRQGCTVPFAVLLQPACWYFSLFLDWNIDVQFLANFHPSVSDHITG